MYIRNWEQLIKPIKKAPQINIEEPSKEETKEIIMNVYNLGKGNRLITRPIELSGINAFLRKYGDLIVKIILAIGAVVVLIMFLTSGTPTHPQAKPKATPEITSNAKAQTTTVEIKKIK